MWCSLLSDGCIDLSDIVTNMDGPHTGIVLSLKVGVPQDAVFSALTQGQTFGAREYSPTTSCQLKNVIVMPPVLATQPSHK